MPKDVLLAQLDNRQIATVFWLIVLGLVMLSQKRTRSTLRPLLKAFLNRKILAVYLLLLAYVALVVFGLQRLGVWNISRHLIDTSVWIVTVAFVMVMRVTAVTRGEPLFQKVIIDALKLTIVLEFLVGLHPFSLPIELGLVPIAVALGVLLAIAESKQEYLPLKKAFSWLVVAIGFVLLWQAVRSVLADVDTILSVGTLLDLIVPSLLTILFLPFMYFLSVFVMYETVFERMNIWNSDDQLVKYAKRRTLVRFGLDLGGLRTWARQNPMLRVASKHEVDGLIDGTTESTATAD